MNCDALSHCEHNLASELHAVGITPVVYLRRGIGYTRPNPLQTSKPYCLRGSEDIHVVAMHLRLVREVDAGRLQVEGDYKSRASSRATTSALEAGAAALGPHQRQPLRLRPPQRTFRRA